MNIGIIGVGIVGSAVQFGLESLGHKVKVHDIKLDTTINNVLHTEICYICVPTPIGEKGMCDTSVVSEVINELSLLDYKGIIAIKSTVTPGTTTSLQKHYPGLKICFVPEFLRERCAIADFCENHDLLVIGTNDKDIFQIIKKSHGKYPEKTIQVTETEAEFCKYFNNIYNATLITFANSFYEVCKASNIDYSVVKDTIVNRKNILDKYLDCNKNLRGFGGMCLPKDTSALSSLSKELGLDIDFFDMILSENKKYKTTVFNGMRK
tara:strand:- start:75 stop:869 length:795 start_codon:yes stop_codon:yes gene_type:complete